MFGARFMSEFKSEFAEFAADAVFAREISRPAWLGLPVARMGTGPPAVRLATTARAVAGRRSPRTPPDSSPASPARSGRTHPSRRPRTGRATRTRAREPPTSAHRPTHRRASGHTGRLAHQPRCSAANPAPSPTSSSPTGTSTDAAADRTFVCTCRMEDNSVCLGVSRASKVSLDTKCSMPRQQRSAVSTMCPGGRPGNFRMCFTSFRMPSWNFSSSAPCVVLSGVNVWQRLEHTRTLEHPYT